MDCNTSSTGQCSGYRLKNRPTTYDLLLARISAELTGRLDSELDFADLRLRNFRRLVGSDRMPDPIGFTPNPFGVVGELHSDRGYTGE